MNKGIAVFLHGSHSDLAATLHGIELARRTESAVHGVFIGMGEDGPRAPSRSAEPPDGSYLTRLQAMTQLADRAGIELRCHLLTGDYEDLLLEFLRRYKISYLVIGADDQRAKRQKIRWLNDLHRRLAEDRAWFHLSFWALVVEPWDEALFEQVRNHWATDLPVFWS